MTEPNGMRGTAMRMNVSDVMEEQLREKSVDNTMGKSQRLDPLGDSKMATKTDSKQSKTDFTKPTPAEVRKLRNALIFRARKPGFTFPIFLSRKSMTSRTGAVCVSIGLAAVISKNAMADSPIDWSTPTTISATTDVLNAGSLNYAYDEITSSTTVNGVTFASGNSFSAFGTNVTITGFNAVNNTAFAGTIYPGLSPPSLSRARWRLLRSRQQASSPAVADARSAN